MFTLPYPNPHQAAVHMVPSTKFPTDHPNPHQTAVHMIPPNCTFSIPIVLCPVYINTPPDQAFQYHTLPSGPPITDPQHWLSGWVNTPPPSSSTLLPPYVPPFGPSPKNHRGHQMSVGQQGGEGFSCWNCWHCYFKFISGMWTRGRHNMVLTVCSSVPDTNSVTQSTLGSK